MKFYASIAAEACMIWLGFEPDSDQSLDPGTGFKFQRDIRKVMHIFG